MRPHTPETIVLRPLSELSRWDRNYRVGNVEAIVASIVRFGFNGTLRVWKDGCVMAGNHAFVALETMRANGAKPPRGIEVKGKEWFVPTVDVSHLSRLEAEAYAVADNRTQELGQNDPERLAALLADIKSGTGSLDGVGYSEAELEALLKAAATPDTPFKQYDESIETGVNKVTCPECGAAFPV
jgi:hypothetical protein